MKNQVQTIQELLREIDDLETTVAELQAENLRLRALLPADCELSQPKEKPKSS